MLSGESSLSLKSSLENTLYEESQQAADLQSVNNPYTLLSIFTYCRTVKSQQQEVHYRYSKTTSYPEHGKLTYLSFDTQSPPLGLNTSTDGSPLNFVCLFMYLFIYIFSRLHFLECFFFKSSPEDMFINFRKRGKGRERGERKRERGRERQREKH